MAVTSLLRSKRARQLPAAWEHSPLATLQGEMNRLFEEFWRGFDLAPSRFFGEEMGVFTPRMDVEETDSEVWVKAELPGLEEKDFELSLERDVLTIRGEKREESQDRSRGWYERSYGSFSRTIPLPCEVDADQASAEYKKGVLRVRLPKTATSKERGRRIPVATS